MGHGSGSAEGFGPDWGRSRDNASSARGELACIFHQVVRRAASGGSDTYRAISDNASAMSVQWLCSQVWHCNCAGISDKGEIIGRERLDGGAQRAFVMRPVP